MHLVKRSLTTYSKDYSALARSYELTQSVTKILRTRDSRLSQTSSFQYALDNFRSNADGFFCSNQDVLSGPRAVVAQGLVLSDKAIVISLDTGGDVHETTDVGFCIYDKSRNSVYKIQLDIKGRKLSRKSGIMDNLLAVPLKVSPTQAQVFITRLFGHYTQLMKGDHDVCLVGHNLERDLKSLMTLNVNVPRTLQKVDTDILCRQFLFPKGLNLGKLARELNVQETKPFHPSVNDAYYTIQVLLKLLSGTECDIPFENLKLSHEEYHKKLHRNLDQFEAMLQIRSLVKDVTGFHDEKTVDQVIKFMCNGSKRPRDFDMKTVMPRIYKALRKMERSVTNPCKNIPKTI